MKSDPAASSRIEATAEVLEILTDHTWRAVLPNGKIIFAFCRPRSAKPVLQVGQRINVTMTLEDFSRGEVAG